MVYLKTGSPSSLLAKFEKAIADKKIVTWRKKDGKFTHSAAQYDAKAWMKPSIETGELRFLFEAGESGAPSDTYAVYHGRLIESFIAHTADDFTLGSASPKPVK